MTGSADPVPTHPDPSTRRRALRQLAVAVVAVSTSAVLATWLLGEPPDPSRGISVALWRCAGGAAILVVAARGRARRLPRRQVGWLLGSGFLLGCHFALFHLALAWTSVAATTTLVAVTPVFVAVGAWAWLREPASRTTLAGMAITVVAATALTAADVATSLRPDALRGDVLALAAAAVIAGSLLIGRRERSSVPAAQYSAIVFSAAAGTLLVLAVATGTPLAPWEGAEWLAVAGMVLGPQLLGHFLLQTVLADLQPTVVATAVLAEPVLGSILAWWALDQVPPAGLVVTGPVVLLGVAVAARGATSGRLRSQPPDWGEPDSGDPEGATGGTGAASVQSE